MRISYSRIQTYNDCPRKEFFKYRLGFASKDAFALNYGTLTHLLLEDKAKGGALLDEITIEDSKKDPSTLIYIDSKTGKASLTPIPDAKVVSMERFPTLTPEQAVNLINDEVVKASKRFAETPEGVEAYPEFYFEEEFNGNTFVGYMDLLTIDDKGVITIIDYKTGKTKPSFVQLDTYAYFAAKAFPEAHTINAAYYFVKTDEFEKKSYTREEALSFERVLTNDIERLVSQGEINVLSKKSYKCNWCDYQNECALYGQFNDVYSQSRNSSDRVQTPVFGSYLSQNVILFDGGDEESRQKAKDLFSLCGNDAFAIDTSYSRGDNRSLIDRYISLAPKISEISFLDESSKQTVIGKSYARGERFEVDGITFTDL